MKDELKKLIDVAAGRCPADVVLKGGNVVDVFRGIVRTADVAICGNQIAGVGEYEGKEIIDVTGKYIMPGLIDSHIHIESSYLSPEELGKILVPHGTSTIIADPHEIVNVCGIRGLDYMIHASKQTKLDIRFMLPSCVPATPFENAGATVNAEDMEDPILRDEILGLGEFMNSVGVIYNDDSVIDKLLVAKRAGKLIDGHSPGVSGKDLNAYNCVGILADHECSTLEEMEERLSNGIYVMLRQGSACHNLLTLVKDVDRYTSRRCLFCSDDRQPETIFKEGHLDNHLRMCVREGIDAITAIQMGTLNAAECFGLKNQGAIAPGYRADLNVVDNLEDFNTALMFIAGELVAKDGEYLFPVEKYDISSVKGSTVVKDFSAEKFKMHLKSGHVNAIGVLPGGVVTEKKVIDIQLDDQGEFVYNPDEDVVKVAVVERHHNTGNVACGFLVGYGIKSGAIALSIAHDSHNIIVTGVSDEDMEFAVRELVKQEGGIIAVKDGKVISSMPMPIAGLMSDKDGKWVEKTLLEIHNIMYNELGVNQEVEPVMTLCFMSLAVIPELKLTDMGLFDVVKFDFIPVETN